MPMQVKPLSDTVISMVNLGEKPVKLFDGGGLFLLVAPEGAKLWRFRYRYQGREKLISLGSYPAVSIESARMMRDDAKRLLLEGIDPSENRKKAKLETVADDQPVTTSVRISNDGMLEIWKGRLVIRLAGDEARFVKDQLCKLIA